MARISFDTLQETAVNNSNNNEGNNIKLFSLKNDGDVAVVRIMHDSIEDFDILTTHKIKIGEKRRSISCIRNPFDPVDACPLCKAQEKLQQRFYIHMIHYVTDTQTGAIVPVPVVWDRAATEYANKFKTLIEEYGPLSNLIFKIKRNGKAGDMSTTYEILMGNQTMYPIEQYPKIDAFNDYTALGKIVMDRNYAEICEYMATGQFPQRTNTNNNVTPKSGVDIDVAVDETPLTQGQAYVQNTQAAPVQNVQPTTQYGTGNTMPWQGNTTNNTVNRPVRRY